MKNKTLQVLEYGKIILMLKEHAGSEMTKKVISELAPFLMSGISATDSRKRQKQYA